MAIHTTAILKQNLIVPQDLKKGIYKINAPYRFTKARTYGYKNKPGFVIVVASIKKGGIEPKIPSRGRTPSKIYSKYSRNISHQKILENRVIKKYKNLKLVKSYYLSENGKTKWFEILLRDPSLISL